MTTTQHTQPQNNMPQPPVKNPKGIRASYAFFIFLGIFGAHRFYLKKTGSAIGFMLTAGGFGIWAIIDAIRMQEMVKNTNHERGTGYQIPKEGVVPKIFVGLGIFAVLSSIGIGTNNTGKSSNDKTPNTNISTEQTENRRTQNDTAIKIEEESITNEADINDVLSTYANNELKGDNTYKNKMFKITGGKVSNISTSGKDVTISLKGNEGRRMDVYCELARSENDKAIDLNEGDSISVQGKITGKGIVGNINVRDCVIAS